MSYYTKITTAGLAAITAAMNNNSKVPITYMAFGDGNGYVPDPDENATSLVNEVYRVGLNKVEVHSKNPNWLVCEAIIPSAVGGFNIREVALYDDTGSKMLAVASYPPTYKPTVEEGAAKIQTIRIVLQIDNAGDFELIIDPDIVLATIEYVNSYKKNDSHILLENKRTQREKNQDSLNLMDFLSESEIEIYKNNPEDLDVKDAFTRAVFSADYFGKKLTGQGVFYTNQTLNLYCDADLSCMTVNSSCPSISVDVAKLDYSYIFSKTIHLPKVICSTKTGKGWSSSGLIGVRTVNLDACFIYVNLIRDFKIGLNCHATSGKGNCYSNYYIKHLNNNQINHQISADNDGSWTNENKFFGGRFSFFSNEGNNVPDTRHIFIKAANFVPNQNIWFSPSIEGNTPEYHLENQGCWNAIYSARWEAEPPKVLYSVNESLTGNEFSIANQGTKNLICHGYNVDVIKVTHTGSGSRKANRIIGSDKEIRSMSSSSGGDRLLNNYSDHAAFESIFPAGTSNLSEAPIAEYLQQRTPYHFRGKRNTDTHPRIELDFQLGEIRFGNGTMDAANAAILKTTSTNGILFNKHLIPSTSNLSLGSSGLPMNAVFSTKFMYSATVGDFFGTGSPEGSLSAGIGSTYRRADGAAGTAFYVKETGTGNTGWIAK